MGIGYTLSVDNYQKKRSELHRGQHFPTFKKNQALNQSYKLHNRYTYFAFDDHYLDNPIWNLNHRHHLHSNLQPYTDK